jgi:hypothetical protein
MFPQEPESANETKLTITGRLFARLRISAFCGRFCVEDRRTLHDMCIPGGDSTEWLCGHSFRCNEVCIRGRALLLP